MRKKIPASRRCLIPFPVRKEKSISCPNVQSRIARNTTLRFDDTACASVASALVKTFIAANENVRTAGWKQPTLYEQLNHIFKVFEKYPVAGGGVMRDLALHSNAYFVVGVVSSLDGQAGVMSPGAASAYRGHEVRHVRVPLHASVGSVTSEILIPDYRREIAEDKFGTPNRGVVSGPYLFVAAIDADSGLALRFRAWPIWLGEHLQIVRSNYERVGISVLVSLGCTCLTVTRRSQMITLQRKLGHNWDGRLTGYKYMPDILVFPALGYRVGVVEIFGLSGYKRYEVAQGKKRKAMTIGYKRGEYAPMPVVVPRGSAAAAAAYITGRLQSFVQGPIYSNCR